MQHLTLSSRSRTSSTGLLLIIAALWIVSIAPALADRDSGGGCKRAGKHCRRDTQCCAGLVCGGAESCVPGCRIDGALYASGAANPRNPCQVCRPENHTQRWSRAADGTSCDDANACTTNDACRSGDCTGGFQRDCDDADMCTRDSCDPATGCVSARVADGEACDMWGTDGWVSATAVSGDTLYVAGDFHWVSPPSLGGFACFDAATAQLSRRFPTVVGNVSAVVSDGAGGWYIGGAFTKVGGVPRRGLAHILADGRVVDWNPGPMYDLSAIAVGGSVVYVNSGGASGFGVTAIDSSTGQTLWETSVDGGVVALALNGNTLYIGGVFQSVGGLERRSLAALDASTGSPTAWNPEVLDLPFSDPGRVSALASRGDRVYVAGVFNEVGGQARWSLAAIDAATGLATDWNPAAAWQGERAEVYTLAIDGSLVYASGGFDHVGGEARRDIAAIDALTGHATTWPGDPGFATSVLAVNQNTVYMGALAIDATTGEPTGWDPTLHGSVAAVATAGGPVCFGGGRLTVGGVSRRGFAAIDLKSGRPTDWNPGPLYEGWSADALAANRDGVFALVKWVGIWKLDPVTGQILWSTNIPGTGLSVAGNTVYTVSPHSQASTGILHAIDAASGLSTETSFPVECLYLPGSCELLTVAAADHSVYIGGYFQQFGGVPRYSAAALDAATGLPTPWEVGPAIPSSPDWRFEVAVVGGDTVYLSDNHGNPPVLAVNSESGSIKWSFGRFPMYIRAIAPSGDIVYVGGVRGWFSPVLAALDAATGQATPWSPAVSSGGTVWAISVGRGVVFVGGVVTAQKNDGPIYQNIIAIRAAGAEAPASK